MPCSSRSSARPRGGRRPTPAVGPPEPARPSELSWTGQGRCWKRRRIPMGRPTMPFVERVFSGVQPTGNLPLGNYLGAIVNFVKMQETHNCIYCVVDMHAITQGVEVWGGPDELASNTGEVSAAFIACGIDVKNNIVLHA